MAIYSVIPCNEVHDSVSEDYSLQESPTCTVKLQCDYADRYSLVADLLANRRPWPFYSAPFVPRAYSCQIENIPTKFAQSGQTIVYEQSEVTVTYNNKVVDLFSEELEPTAEFQELNAKNFCWNNALRTPLQQGEAPGFLRRGLILNRTLFQVPDPLPSSLLDFVGCCNASTIVNSMGLVFQPETLLYIPPHLSRTVSWGGNNAWQVAMKFQHKPTGWNTFWNPADQAFEQIRTIKRTWGVSSGTSQIYKPCPPAEFNGVFF